MGLKVEQWVEFCRGKRLDVGSGKPLAVPESPVEVPAPVLEGQDTGPAVSDQPRSISVWVAGLPKGQPRPRAFSRGGKASVYDPGTAEGWKSQIAQACQPYANLRLLGPISLELAFFFPRPKSHFRKGLVRPDAPTHYTSKPDFDNLEKAIADCLTTIGLWADDAQVCENHTTKQYTDTAKSGCAITVRKR